MNITNVFSAVTVTQMLKAASVAATANGTAMDLVDYEGQVAVVTSIGDPSAGSSPTMDVKLQDSADGSTAWADISGAAITQVTATGNTQKIVVNSDNVKRYIREVHTIGGTSSPAFPMAINLHGIKKYPA